MTHDAAQGADGMVVAPWAALCARYRIRLAAASYAEETAKARREASSRAAQRCLSGFGRAAAGLGHAQDGRPLWPQGLCGSLTRRAGLAVAVAGRDEVLSAIGVDLEETAALPAAEAAVVLAPEEQALVCSSEHPDEIATLIWSAKESAFKAWSNAAGGLDGVDPCEIVIGLSPAQSSGVADACAFAFLARPAGSLARRLGEDLTLHGEALVRRDLTFTLAVALKPSHLS